MSFTAFIYSKFCSSPFSDGLDPRDPCYDIIRESETQPSDADFGFDWPANDAGVQFVPVSGWRAPETVDTMMALRSNEASTSAGAQHTQTSQGAYPSLKFVIENPAGKSPPRERKKRSQIDIDQQKASTGKLKEFGGACLWCYRSKKKCDTEDTCYQCRQSRRTCIRASAQLCLMKMLDRIDGTPASGSPGPPSPYACEVLRDLLSTAFEKNERGDVHVSFLHESNSLSEDAWIMEGPKSNGSPSDPPTRRAIREFANLLWPYLRFSEITELENNNYSVPLFEKVMEIVKLFLTIQSLTTCQVHINSSCGDQAKAIIFLIVTSCCQYMAELSENFSTDLTETLRRRDMYETYDNGMCRSSDSSAIHPVWVATGLYYRVIKGLLVLQSNTVVAQVFESMDDHLLQVRDSLWCILKHIPFCKPGGPKTTFKQAMERNIPNFDSNKTYSMVVSWIFKGQPETTLISPDSSPQNGPPSEQGSTMESLLGDKMRDGPAAPVIPKIPQKTSSASQNIKQPIQSVISQSLPTYETNNTSSAGGGINAQGMHNAIIRRNVIDLVHDSPQVNVAPGYWDSSLTMDSFYMFDYGYAGNQ